MMQPVKTKVVILTGAGMSAESGIPTFRDMGGIWQKYDITQVASPEAWLKDPELVLNFYNERRKRLLECAPNQGHIILAELQQSFDVQIITQNVDDLHERAGSKTILHLHGELRKARSTKDPDLVVPITGHSLNMEDRCPLGSNLRPHIVWFGEKVLGLDEAENLVKQADWLIIIGTSLTVYPAANLHHFAKTNNPIVLIDPSTHFHGLPKNIVHWKLNASEGCAKLKSFLHHQI